MSNMSYCRFENTLGDLAECAYHITDDLGSESEFDARIELVEVCREIIKEWESFDMDNVEFEKEKDEDMEEEDDTEDD
jgi:hypothetical protein